jgi:ABC-type branched-subunit amino acid transport system substrate-binding protein
MDYKVGSKQVKISNWGRNGRLAIAATMLIALAGCKTVIPSGDAPRTSEAPVEAPDVAEQPIDNVVAADNQRHRIALLLPLSGSNANIGTSLANATTLALLDTKADNIRITRYDTAKGAGSAARKAIADGNTLILGPLLADNVRAASRVARPAGVPIISYSNDVSVAGNGTFIMGFVPDQSVERIIAYARSQGLTRFAGLTPDGEYGQRSASALLRAVNNSGGAVVRMESYNRTGASLRSAINKMRSAKNYDALLIADSGQTAIRAIPLIRSSGSNARILGTELWNTDNNLSGAPSARGAWFASVSDGLYNQYANKYRQQFSASPFRLSSLGYDSVLLTYRVARDWKVNTPFPVDRLRDSDGFVGLDGAFRFGSSGVAERALEVQEVRTSGFAIVSAAPRSFDD